MTVGQECPTYTGLFFGDEGEFGVAVRHATADAVVVVFGFDDCQRDILFPRQQEIRKLAFASFDSLAAHKYLTCGEVVLFTDLMLNVPPC